MFKKRKVKQKEWRYRMRVVRKNIKGRKRQMIALEQRTKPKNKDKELRKEAKRERMGKNQRERERA